MATTTRCHAAMKQLADTWDNVGADIAVILGNDQNEIYETDELNPPFMVFCGDTIPNYPQSERCRRKRCRREIAEAGTRTCGRHLHRIWRRSRKLGTHIIKTLIEHDFDVAASKKWPKNARNGASHAFGHIYRQVMRDKVVPNVPIYQNTFFPPNQPKAARSYEFGRIVKKAIDFRGIRPRRWPCSRRAA